LQDTKLPSIQDVLDRSRRKLLQYLGLLQRVPSSLGTLER
jgi:hypothetical protein